MNALSPMLVTLDGIVIEVNDGLENATEPMLVNLEPASNVTEVKLVAPWNARSPMLVILAGMVIDVKLDGPPNAYSPMLV